MQYAFAVCAYKIKVATETKAYVAVRTIDTTTEVEKSVKYLDFNSTFRIHLQATINLAIEKIRLLQAHAIRATDLLVVKNQLIVHMQEIKSVKFDSSIYQDTANRVIKEIIDTIQKIDNAIQQPLIVRSGRQTSQLLADANKACASAVYLKRPSSPDRKTLADYEIKPRSIDSYALHPKPLDSKESEHVVAKSPAPEHHTTCSAQHSKLKSQRRDKIEQQSKQADHTPAHLPLRPTLAQTPKIAIQPEQHAATDRQTEPSHTGPIEKPLSSGMSTLFGNLAETLFHRLEKLDQHAKQYADLKARLETTACRIGKYISIITASILVLFTLSRSMRVYKNIGLKHALKEAFIGSSATGIISTFLYKYTPRAISRIIIPAHTRHLTELLHEDDQAITQELRTIARDANDANDNRQISTRLQELNKKQPLESERAQQKYSAAMRLVS